jgi:hypothetical protein
VNLADKQFEFLTVLEKCHINNTAIATNDNMFVAIFLYVNKK